MTIPTWLLCLITFCIFRIYRNGKRMREIQEREHRGWRPTR